MIKMTRGETLRRHPQYIHASFLVKTQYISIFDIKGPEGALNYSNTAYVLYI